VKNCYRVDILLSLDLSCAIISRTRFLLASNWLLGYEAEWIAVCELAWFSVAAIAGD
jgi:hypothetical protein